MKEGNTSMNYEEFKNVIGECIQDTDKLTENADTILEAFKLAIDTAEARVHEIDTLKTKNEDLRDMNQKLLMRQTFNAPEEKEIEEPPKKTDAEILDEIIKEMNA